MNVADYVLDGLERWLEVERECGTRALEVDRSLLTADVGDGTKRTEGANATDGVSPASRQAPTAQAS